MDPYFQQQKASEECRTMGGSSSEAEFIDRFLSLESEVAWLKHGLLDT